MLFAVDPTTLAEILDDDESLAVRSLSDAVAVMVSWTDPLVAG